MKRFTMFAVLVGVVMASSLITRPALTNQESAAKPSALTQLEQLQKERNDTLEKVISIVRNQFLSGRVDFVTFSTPHMELVEARFDATKMPGQRVALLKDQRKIAEELLHDVSRARQVGTEVSDVDYQKAIEHLQNIEIKILKEQKPEAQAGLEQLSRERIEACTRQLGIELYQCKLGRSYARFFTAQQEFIDAKLDATDRADNRIVLLDQELKIAQEILNSIEKSPKAALPSPETELLKAKAHCRAIEIRLFKEKKTEDAAKLGQLQKERNDALEQIISIVRNQYRSASVDFATFSVAQMEFIEAKFDVIKNPADRIALLEEQLKIARDVFAGAGADTDARQRDGSASEVDKLRAKALCLTVEIKLAKEHNRDKSGK